MITATAFWQSKKETGPPFIFSVTVGAGQSFQLPTISAGTYDAVINWGDGDSDVLTVWNATERTHTYTSAGTYDISISGTFRGWQVNNYADRLKITEVKQWGIIEINGTNAFYGCANLTISATDVPKSIYGPIGQYFFRGCSSLTTVPNIHLWDFSSFLSVEYFFQGCPLFNQDLSGVSFPNATAFSEFLSGVGVFNSPVPSAPSGRNFGRCFQNKPLFNQNISTLITASTTGISYMLLNCDAFDQDLSACNIVNLVSALNFMQNATGLSTANYDATLIAWAAQAPVNAVAIHFGGSKYTAGGAAEAARTTLITTYGWTITDGGAV